jgi:endonuclease/exonuclease/phosphatase family metal-dependent hydrolase
MRELKVQSAQTICRPQVFYEAVFDALELVRRIRDSPFILRDIIGEVRISLPIMMLRKLFYLAVIALPSIASAGNAIIATLNVRIDAKVDRENGNGWEKRLPIVTDLIRFHGFDIVATQEVLPHQEEDMKRLLPGYGVVGFGRDNGAELGERVVIFFKQDKFKKLEEGRFWLSEKPDEAGKGWDASLPRICTWVKLEDATTKERLSVFNIHFDHRGAKSKVESSKLMLTKSREIAGNDLTVVLGDFNQNEESEGHKILANDGRLLDAYQVAGLRYAPTGTMNGFMMDQATVHRIDHIFLSPQFKVSRYGILTDTYREMIELPEAPAPSDIPAGELKFRNGITRAPSDHFPVMVDVSYGQPGQ